MWTVSLGLLWVLWAGGTTALLKNVRVGFFCWEGPSRQQHACTCVPARPASPYCLCLYCPRLVLPACTAQQMDELPLLRDAITNLDDVFLVVVVGEFNSGKSTVINALLGEKFLADGILPTTNEISVLK